MVWWKIIVGSIIIEDQIIKLWNFICAQINWPSKFYMSNMDNRCRDKRKPEVDYMHLYKNLHMYNTPRTQKI